ncbi:MAG: type II toxin-antitoxin system PemK/MazF family toxin [bacterium]|nr:type II toxin-antitoxin system PemK/MazF family toxin [bacterium]MDZ4284921.1 type II toxin-antitoxin system PemK/MazF family toxin [Patescibacteria group bacterium]
MVTTSRKSSRGLNVPERGDLVWMTFNPSLGHEQGSRRPAIVLSSRYYNERVGLALVCPITSQQKGYPFEIALPHGKVEGVILADHVRSVDWKQRKSVFITTVPSETVSRVRGRLVDLLTED